MKTKGIIFLVLIIFTIFIFSATTTIAESFEFTPIVKVNDTPLGIEADWTSHLIVDKSGNIIVGFTDKRYGGNKAFITRSTDEGNTWEPSVEVSPANSHHPNPPMFAVDNSRDAIYAIFRYGYSSQYFSKSYDAGQTWSQYKSTGINMVNWYGDVEVGLSGNVYPSVA